MMTSCLFERFHDVPKLLGKRGFHDNVFAFPFEFEARAVEKEPFEAEVLFEFAVEGEVPVARVANERVPDAFEVGADLVHSSRFEVDFYKVVAFEAFLERVMRNGRNAFLGAGLHFGACLGIGAFQGLADGTALLFEVSLDKGQVRFLNFVFAEHAREVAERVAVKGRQEKSRSFFVEAVGERRLKIQMFVVSPLPEHFDKALALSRARSRLARDSGRLVDCDKVFLFERNVQVLGNKVPVGERGRVSPGFFGFGIFRMGAFEALEIFVDIDRVAFAEHLRGLGVDAVDANLLFAENGEERGKRFVRKSLSQKAVEAHIGEVSVDDSGNHKNP